MEHEIKPSESLPVGLLLALAGGILDAYTYLVRGEVFATAETGNLRSGTEFLFRRVVRGERTASGKARLYYGLILSFVTGAVISGLLSGSFGEKTVLLAVVPLGIAFAKMF